MLDVDQQLRIQNVHGVSNGHQAEIDRKQTERMNGANAAWVLIHHAVDDPEFQEMCLPLVRNAAESGEPRMALCATLEDRIRINAGKLQRFGTIMMIQLNHASMTEGD